MRLKHKEISLQGSEEEARLAWLWLWVRPSTYYTWIPIQEEPENRTLPYICPSS